MDRQPCGNKDFISNIPERINQVPEQVEYIILPGIKQNLLVLTAAPYSL